MTTGEQLAEDVRAYMAESKRNLDLQVAALNRLRAAMALKPLRVVVDTRERVA